MMKYLLVKIRTLTYCKKKVIYEKDVNMLKYTNDYLPSKTTDRNILCNKTTVVCPESI